MRTVLRRTAVPAAALATLFGGALVIAPAAAAVDSSSCTWWHQENEMIYGANVHFRTGPSTGYTSKGILTNHTDVYAACGTRGYVYVKALEGAHRSEKGWVTSEYVTGLFILTGLST